MFHPQPTSYTEMNTERFKKMLLDRRRELLDEIPVHDDEARAGTNTDVEDPIDQVVSGEVKAGSFHENSIRRQILVDIDDALRRIDEGTYGICIDCGRPIEQARLEAVPWARYCLEDQKKHEAEETAENDTLLQ
jgi:DnaK suppressor protein